MKRKSKSLVPVIVWSQLLDKLKTSANLNDRELANYLAISPVTLSRYRTGAGHLPASAKLRLLDRAGFHVASEVIEIILGDERAANLLKVRRRRAAELASDQSLRTAVNGTAKSSILPPQTKVRPTH